MRAHRRLRLVGIAQAQGLDNRAMFRQGLGRSAGPEARPEPVQSHHVIQVFRHRPEQPLVVAGTGNPKMEILIAARLIIRLAGRHLRLRGMAAQTVFDGLKFGIGHPLGSEAAGEPLHCLTQFEQALQVIQRQIDHAGPKMRHAVRKALGLKPENRLTRRTTADTEAQGDLVLADWRAWRDLAHDNRLHNPGEDLIR